MKLTDYKGFELRVPDTGGKAGRGKNATGSLQVFDTGSSCIRKQFRFRMGVEESMTGAARKARLFIDAIQPGLNWKEHVLQTVPHSRFKGRKLGEVSEVELRVLRDHWLTVPGVMEIRIPNSSQTIARYADVLNIMAAVEGLA